MKRYVARIVTRALPLGSKRRKVAKRLIKGKDRAVTAVTSISYDDWIKNCEPGVWSYTDKAALDKLKNKPKISIVVPCYNTPDNYLGPLLKSVRGQLYDNWELLLIDGSDAAERQRALEAAAVDERRITYHRVGKNLGIVGNTNIGINMASGKYVAFMDHDDTLSPHALAEVVGVINTNPEAELIYSDEDKMSDDGKIRLLPFFKPDWSPEMLLGVNYITHFVVVKTGLVHNIGGLRSGFDGAQDYDFLLRLTESAKQIYHIPKILYHWRQAVGSTAGLVTSKGYADTAGQQALRDAVKRRRIQAEVIAIPDRPSNYRLRYVLPKHQPSVSIIIPFKDKVELLKVCVPSILKSSYANYEIILLSNNSVEAATHDYLDRLRNDKRCKVFIWDHPFNYSALNNFGRTQAKGDYLVFLNNDTEILETDWLEELIGTASQPEIGAVGPLLLYPDRRIQHAGITLGMRTMAGHPFRLRQPHEWTDYGLAVWPRNYLAVTGACMAVKTEKFDAVGGFDEQLTVGGNDVAFCIRLTEKGWRTLYWPFTSIIHYENASVGDYNSSVPIGDYNRSLKYYKPYLNYHDPYFNRNLDIMDEYIGIRRDYETSGA